MSAWADADGENQRPPAPADAAGSSGLADPTPARRPTVVIAMAVALALIAAAVFSRGLQGPFVYDDNPAIVENVSIRVLTDLPTVLAPPLETPVAGRPISNLSLAIDYAIWGLNPLGYKLHNLLLHILSGWLLLGILRRTLADGAIANRFHLSPDWLAFGIVLLWVVHPLYGEVVAYAAQRTEALASFFMLLVFYACIRGWSDGRTRLWLPIAVVAHLLGLGAKEIVVTLLPLLWIYDRAFVSGSFLGALKAHRWWYVSLAATLLVLLITHRENPRAASTGFSHGVTVWENLLTQSNVLVYYVKSVLWPDRLYIVNDWPIVSHWLLAIPAGPIVLLLLGLTFYCVWRYPKAGFIGCWFFFILAPTSSILPIPSEVAADRRMYLPSLAVIAVATLLALWALQSLVRLLHAKPRLAGNAWLLLVAVATVALALRNVQHQRAFESEMTFWRTAVQADPQSKWANEGLALELARSGQVSEALVHARIAALQMSHTPRIMVFLGKIHYVLGDAEKAEQLHWRAYRVAPNHRNTARQLASFLRRVGKRQEALDLMRQTAERQPSGPSYHLLGELLIETGQASAAVEALQRADELQPHNFNTLTSLGLAYNLQRQPQRALAPLTAAARLNPTSAQAHHLLGATHAELGNLEQAAAHFRRALELDPGHIHARQSLGKIEKTPGFGGSN